MAEEDTVLEEAMDNLKEAGQRMRATQGLLRSQGMIDGENHRDLLTRLSTALAMTEAAYLEARRRRDLQVGPTAGVLEERDDTGILLSITDPQRGSVEHRFFPWSSVITMAASMG